MRSRLAQVTAMRSATFGMWPLPVIFAVAPKDGQLGRPPRATGPPRLGGLGTASPSYWTRRAGTARRPRAAPPVPLRFRSPRRSPIHPPVSDLDGTTRDGRPGLLLEVR